MKKIRYVDGFAIRSRLDPDFGVIQSHCDCVVESKNYIPDEEIWIDKQFKNETKFLIKFYELFHNAKNKNISYQKWRKEIQKNLPDKKFIPPFIHQQEKINGLIIQYVDGSIIRQFLDPEFIFGGHKFVYDYVPAKTIWVDNLQNRQELPYTLFHEIMEYKQMKKGMTYDQAHDIATAFEKAKRRDDGVGRYPGDDNYTKKDTIPYVVKK